MSVSESEIIRLLGPLKKAVAKPQQKTASQPRPQSMPEQVALGQPIVDQTSPITQGDLTKASEIFEFNREDLARGIILATILGKPRSKSRGRW